ncbi:MAG: AMIN domain-containing protein [Terriglobales bacterium]
MKHFLRKLPFRQKWLRFVAPISCCALLALGLLALAAPYLLAQTKPSTQTDPPSKPAASSDATKTATIKSFRIVQEKDGPAVEILSTRPLVPSIQAITGPDRLVIDLPNARLDSQQKRISVQADEITTLRADQFQQDPPIARVVVDLLAPRAYTWDAAGNRLVVHLGKNPNLPNGSPFQTPTVASLSPRPQPVVAAVRAAEPLPLATKESGDGSTIAALADTTIVGLSGGGELRVCPGTTVSVTPSQNRHNRMFSLNTGALEAHFSLDASSDSVVTPDFRILLVGPGEFHYAISADNQGNTCVRSLPGNTASAIVTELMGDRTYQVKATDQLVFRAGQLDRVDMAVPLECGCPPPRNASLLAANNAPSLNDAQPSLHTSAAASDSAPAPEAAHADSAALPGLPAAPPAPPLDASLAPNQLHVQIEAPFVFHATGPPPAPVEEVRALPFDFRRLPEPGSADPLPPPAAPQSEPADSQKASKNNPPSRGFFKRLGGFLASLFH